MTLGQPEVVVTGMGVVSPIGVGLAAFRQSLRAGTSGIGRLQAYDPVDFPVQIAGEVLDFDGKMYVKPRKSLKVMSRDLQFGFAAAEMACEHAGLPDLPNDPDRMGVVFAADMIYGELEEFPPAYRQSQVDGHFNFARWSSVGQFEVFPLLMLKYLPNMAACQLAIARDARGPNNTVSLGEASGLLAIGEAMHTIQRGWADVMIAGGMSSPLHPMRFCRMRAYDCSRRNEDPAGALRPFDADRNGLVFGEGAAALILEGADHARRRGAPIVARLHGFGNNFGEDWRVPGERAKGVRAAAAKQAMIGALREAGWQSTDVGHVNANGLSTVVEDRLEAQAIRDVLGNVPVTAPKSYFGNLVAGGSIVELVASLACLSDGEVPPTLNYHRPDAACPVNVIRCEAARPKRRTLLKINQSLTGQTAALAISMEV